VTPPDAFNFGNIVPQSGQKPGVTDIIYLSNLEKNVNKNISEIIDFLLENQGEYKKGMIVLVNFS
jgi:hypothetical protein